MIWGLLSVRRLSTSAQPLPSLETLVAPRGGGRASSRGERGARNLRGVRGGRHFWGENHKLGPGHHKEWWCYQGWGRVLSLVFLYVLVFSSTWLSWPSLSYQQELSVWFALRFKQNVFDLFLVNCWESLMHQSSGLRRCHPSETCKRSIGNLYHLLGWSWRRHGFLEVVAPPKSKVLFFLFLFLFLLSFLLLCFVLVLVGCWLLLLLLFLLDRSFELFWTKQKCLTLPPPTLPDHTRISRRRTVLCRSALTPADVLACLSCRMFASLVGSLRSIQVEKCPDPPGGLPQLPSNPCF